MESSDSIHRTAPAELALRLQQTRPDDRRQPFKKRPRKIVEGDHIELHDEEIDPAVSTRQDNDSDEHLDISA